MNSPIRQLMHVALITALILPTAGAAGLIILRARGERLLSVQSASMVPTFRPGDAVIVQPVSLSNLRPGDIISYQSPHDSKMIITHRLVRSDPKTGQLVTAGDALHAPDQPFSPLRVIGRTTAVAPRLGTVLNALRRPFGLVITVYLPATLIVITEAARLTRHYRRPLYLLDCRHGTKY